MKIIFVMIFCVAPVFACKMTPETAMRRAEDAAKEVVTAKTKRKDLLSKHDYPFWYVRTTKPSCVEYKVGVENASVSCKMKAKILGEKPCK